MAYIDEFGKVFIATTEGYVNELEVLNNNDKGFFFIGTVITPEFFIGKKVIINIEIIED